MKRKTPSWFNGALFRQLRVSRNLTQDQLAAVCGVSKQIYSRYERGEVDPSTRSLCLLCRYWHIRLTEAVFVNPEKIISKVDLTRPKRASLID